MSILTKTNRLVQKSGQSALIILGSLVLIIWLILSPDGIMGKADAIGYAVCHRIDVRSFHIGLTQMPLCARCTGQYLGAVLGLAFLAITSRKRSGFPTKRVSLVLVALVCVYLVDGLNSYLYLPPFTRLFPTMPHLYQPSNILRLFSGTGMGIVIAMLLYPAFIGSIYPKPDPKPAVSGLAALVILVFLGAGMDLLVLTGSSFILFPAALVSAAGVLLLLTMAFSVLWMRILGHENTYTHMSQLLLPLLSGFMITMILLAAIDLARFIITGTWSGFNFG